MSTVDTFGENGDLANSRAANISKEASRDNWTMYVAGERMLEPRTIGSERRSMDRARAAMDLPIAPAVGC